MFTEPARLYVRCQKCIASLSAKNSQKSSSMSYILANKSNVVLLNLDHSFNPHLSTLFHSMFHQSYHRHTHLFTEARKFFNLNLLILFILTFSKPPSCIACPLVLSFALLMNWHPLTILPFTSSFLFSFFPTCAHVQHAFNLINSSMNVELQSEQLSANHITSCLPAIVSKETCSNET